MDDTKMGLSEFLVLPLKFSASSSSYHELFIKAHICRSQSAKTPRGRTLFISNVPSYVTEESLRRIFEVAGSIENIFIKTRTLNDQDSISGFKMAYIVYLKQKYLQNALKLTKLECLSTSEAPIVCGIKKWIEQYNQSIPNPKGLQENINAFMLQYDKKQLEINKKETAEDEDGWTTVTKYGRKPGLSRSEAVQDRIKTKMEKKKKELTNFYTFQIRDSKMKHLAGLRQKFEEDKKKIAVLKQTRKFKPFL